MNGALFIFRQMNAKTVRLNGRNQCWNAKHFSVFGDERPGRGQKILLGPLKGIDAFGNYSAEVCRD